jgi:hypothetical protein
MASTTSATTTVVATEATSASSIASLPSGKPIDSSAPKSNRPPPSLASLLTAGPYAVDSFLARLHRCLQTRSGADTVLFFICYASRFAGAALEDISRSALRHAAQNLIALAVKLPPSTTVTFDSAPLVSPAAAIALQLSARLKALAATLSEIRTFGRLWGLLGLYFASKNLVKSALAPPKKEGEANGDGRTRAQARFDTFWAAAQILALVSFQLNENIVYLASKKILGVSPATQGRLGRLSVRSWAVYTFMELARLLIVRQRRASARASGELTAKDAEWRRDWTKDFTRNLSWAPMTVHFSVENGPLNELGISALGLYPAISQMRELWADNA